MVKLTINVRIENSCETVECGEILVGFECSILPWLNCTKSKGLGDRLHGVDSYIWCSTNNIQGIIGLGIPSTESTYRIQLSCSIIAKHSRVFIGVIDSFFETWARLRRSRDSTWCMMASRTSPGSICIIESTMSNEYCHVILFGLIYVVNKIKGRRNKPNSTSVVMICCCQWRKERVIDNSRLTG